MGTLGTMVQPSAGPDWCDFSFYIPPNHTKGARVTARTLSPLSPLSPPPPFWSMVETVEDPAALEPAVLEVGTVNKSGAFDAVQGSEQGSEQSEHPWASVEPVERSKLPLPADADWAAPETSRRREPDALDAWGLTETERSESLARIQASAAEKSPQFEDSSEDSPAVCDIPQTIPHETMLAGLRAVGGYWAPRAIGCAVIAEKSGQVGHSTEVDANPWATGVAQLQRMPPLPGLSLVQWARVQRGCASLLAEWGADMRRLGWSTEDGFGIHPDASGAAVHAYGLGLLLGDGRVVELTEAGARIETVRGVRQSFRRKPMPWSVPVWMVGADQIWAP